ncbi:Conserved hypothetical protein [Clostridium neonatale]|nr:Conserved hypothetical protein [Clostridium neonatale]
MKVMNRIYEKLNDIQELDDKVILKKIMMSVFSSLEEYSNEKYAQLEERVFDEVEYVEEKYNIYSTIIRRNELDMTDEIFFPMIEKDKEEKTYDIKDLLGTLRNNKTYELFSIFLKCDYCIFKKFINSNLKIKGTITTNKRAHEAYFKVVENSEYKQKISNLYKSFINNNIRWKTVNMPYVNKIAKVMLVSYEGEFEKDESIMKIDIDFEEYSKYIKYDMVPIWNVKNIKMKCNGFPVPCIDKINYEHNISLAKEGKDSGYLVNASDEEINYVTFKDDSILLTSKISNPVTWRIYKIVNYKEDKIRAYEYEIINNYMNINFSNKFLFNNRYMIKSKSEIARLIGSFKISEKLIFKDVVVEDLLEEESREIYDANDFIIDEIREDNVKKALVLYFESRNKEDYLNNDILSFLVGEVQFIYPEYKCEGRLI